MKQDWEKYTGTVSLPRIYDDASHLQEAVYLRWLETLRRFLFDHERGKEAARRMEYIETHLLKAMDQ